MHKKKTPTKRAAAIVDRVAPGCHAQRVPGLLGGSHIQRVPGTLWVSSGSRRITLCERLPAASFGEALVFRARRRPVPPTSATHQPRSLAARPAEPRAHTPNTGLCPASTCRLCTLL